MEPGEAALDHPTVDSQPRAVEGAVAGDGRHDAALWNLVAVNVVVVPSAG